MKKKLSLTIHITFLGTTLFLFTIFTNCSAGDQREVRNEASFERLKKETQNLPPEDPSEKEFDETGLASWYGIQFQNRKTSSGELFDKDKLTGAHRTLPMFSEVKVKNLENQKEIVIKINDRGPFNNARIIDVSEKVAELLDFKESGLAKIGIMVLNRGEDAKLAKEDDFNIDDDDDEDDEQPESTRPPRKEEPRNKTREKSPKKPPITPMKENREAKETPKTSPPPNAVIDIQPKGFTIQIGVFKEKKRADSLKNELKSHVSEPIFIFMRGNTFVMQIGDFTSRDEAVALRDRLKLKGYFSFIPPK